MFIAALVYTNRIRNNLNVLFCLLKMLYYVGVSLNNKVVVSSVQQSDSVIHIHVSLLFQILFPLGCYILLSRVVCAISRSLGKCFIPDAIGCLPIIIHMVGSSSQLSISV